MVPTRREVGSLGATRGGCYRSAPRIYVWTQRIVHDSDDRNLVVGHFGCARGFRSQDHADPKPCPPRLRRLRAQHAHPAGEPAIATSARTHKPPTAQPPDASPHRCFRPAELPRARSGPVRGFATRTAPTCYLLATWSFIWGLRGGAQSCAVMRIKSLLIKLFLRSCAMCCVSAKPMGAAGFEPATSRV